MCKVITLRRRVGGLSWLVTGGVKMAWVAVGRRVIQEDSKVNYGMDGLVLPADRATLCLAEETL